MLPSSPAFQSAYVVSYALHRALFTFRLLVCNDFRIQPWEWSVTAIAQLLPLNCGSFPQSHIRCITQAGIQGLPFSTHPCCNFLNTCLQADLVIQIGGSIHHWISKFSNQKNIIPQPTSSTWGRRMPDRWDAKSSREPNMERRFQFRARLCSINCCDISRPILLVVSFLQRIASDFELTGAMRNFLYHGKTDLFVEILEKDFEGRTTAAAAL